MLPLIWAPVCQPARLFFLPLFPLNFGTWRFLSSNGDTSRGFSPLSRLCCFAGRRDLMCRGARTGPAVRRQVSWWRVDGCLHHDALDESKLIQLLCREALIKNDAMRIRINKETFLSSSNPIGSGQLLSYFLNKVMLKWGEVQPWRLKWGYLSWSSHGWCYQGRAPHETQSRTSNCSLWTELRIA